MEFPPDKNIFSNESNILIKKFEEQKFNLLESYQYLEEIKISDQLVDDIDFSYFRKLKKLEINVNSDINITLPRSLEYLIIIGSTYANDILITLKNYENIKTLYLNNINIIINFEIMTKLEKIKLSNVDNINDRNKIKNDINFSKCKNLYYIEIENEEEDKDLSLLNLEGCEKLEFIESTNYYIEKLILPLSSNNLETLILNTYNEIDENRPKLEIINFYDNVNIKKIFISFILQNGMGFTKFKKLEDIIIRNNNMISLNISKNYNLKNIEIQNCKLDYIDFPYNFDITKVQYIFENNFPNKRIISRRRMYLLRESVEGPCESFSKENSKDLIKCFKCKKNISIYNKINIRKTHYNDANNNLSDYNYISCC